MLTYPVGIYINWSAYDELSDRVELTEEIAMTQLEHMIRLRKLGARLDYYMMDAFWYARDGGYRTFRKPHWPDGPDRWLSRCAEEGIKPGLWLATNSTWCNIDVLPEWQSSLDPTSGRLTFAEGGYREHLFATLDMWYRRGVRMYKWDFAALDAATPAMRRSLLPEEIRAANISAFRTAMLEFRRSHPDCLHIGYNGYEQCDIQSGTGVPLCKAISTEWLDIFDSLYCGDPRPADVPAMNFWRSKDIYTDHMVRVYEFNGYPLARIDNAGFMIGTTLTCYCRGKEAWKAMLLLSLARGGNCNTYYGNLDLLTDEEGRWAAKAQSFFWPAIQRQSIRLLGGMPGDFVPYGYEAWDERGTLLTWVNPTQEFVEIAVPAGARILFADERLPELRGGKVKLGPEQMVLLGVGGFADAACDLGLEPDVRIVKAIAPVAATFKQTDLATSTTLTPSFTGTLRIVMRQTHWSRNVFVPKRINGGKGPTGTSLGKVLTLAVRNASTGAEIPVRINYDKVIWSALSWAVGECEVKAGEPLEIRAGTTEKGVRMDVSLHSVSY